MEWNYFFSEAVPDCVGSCGRMAFFWIPHVLAIPHCWIHCTPAFSCYKTGQTMYIHFLLFLVLLSKITAAVLLVFVLCLGVSCDNYMRCSIREILADRCPIRYREYFTFSVVAPNMSNCMYDIAYMVLWSYFCIIQTQTHMSNLW